MYKQLKPDFEFDERGTTFFQELKRLWNIVTTKLQKYFNCVENRCIEILRLLRNCQEFYNANKIKKY